MAVGRRHALRVVGGAALAAALGPGLAAAQRRGPEGRGGQSPEPDAFEGVPIIDTHAHLVFRRGDAGSLFAAAAAAVETMDRLRISHTLILPPPQPDGFARGYDGDELRPAFGGYSQRFGFLSGGGTLNPMLHRYAATADVPASVVRAFQDTAVRIADSGAAGFGELTTEHLSFESNHPYVAAPPDHPLLLRLADIAAERGLPIDLHMEALPRDMALPQPFAGRSPLNPSRLRANIDRFEHLLSHNRKARIVWVHAGWDNTGERTPTLMQRLLQSHPNLYMNIKIVGPPEGQPNNPLARGAQVKPEWLALFRAFPDRFAIGTDNFHAPPAERGRRRPVNPAGRLLINALPPDLAAGIASGNARRIYRLANG